MKREVETKFFTFNQNNSGGYYIQNDDVDAFVIIEALDAENVIDKSYDIFENYQEYCSCCGRRWSDYIDDSDGKDEPMIFGKKIEELNENFWCRKNKVIIYYFDNTKSIYNLETKEWEVKNKKR